MCSAKTSTAGPGYHAFLVDWLAGLQAAQRFDWRADGEDEGDETDYWTHHDFQRVQEEMCHLLARICEVVNQKDDSGRCEPGGLMLGMPLGFPHIVGQADAISNLGFWSRAWFDAVLAGSQPIEAASRFFPWWNRDMDAEFWKRMGLVLSWVEVPWHAPADDDERQTCELALGCFSRARKLDPSIELPDDDVNELAQLLAGDDEMQTPRPDGVGFYRREMTRALTGGWKLRLPGYYYANLEDDDTTQVYWWKGRTVRGSSFSFKRKDGAEGPATEILREDEPADPTLTFADERHAGRASVERKSSDEDGEYWLLSGRMVTEGSLCHVTICYDDDTDSNWAADCWRSLRSTKGDTE